MTVLACDSKGIHYLLYQDDHACLLILCFPLKEIHCQDDYASLHFPLKRIHYQDDYAFVLPAQENSKLAHLYMYKS